MMPTWRSLRSTLPLIAMQISASGEFFLRNIEFVQGVTSVKAGFPQKLTVRGGNGRQHCPDRCGLFSGVGTSYEYGAR
jgi:hypothetical protein